jgi:cell division protein FtsA
MNRNGRIACGLDIGTRKACAVVVRSSPDGTLTLAGSGCIDSLGLHKGVVVNLEAAAASIRGAAEDLEAKSGISIDWLVAGISGDHIRGHNCRGAMAVQGKHGEVTVSDLAQVIHGSQSVSLPGECAILHVLPQDFCLDEHKGIRNPVGLTGAHLAANVHVVTADGAVTQNLINAVNKAQMRVRKVAFLPLASGEAVLTPDEKEAGTALIDIGGGTTGIALFAHNSVCFAAVIPVGGDHFTNDLADGLNAPYLEAERLKREFGDVLPERIAAEEMISVRGFGNRGMRELPRREACEILHYRAVELLQIARGEIDRSGLRDQLIAGAVLTGGGSMLQGILEAAAEIFRMPVRLGLPRGIDGLTNELMHPAYAGAIGLAMIDAQDASRKTMPHARPALRPSLAHRILSWLGD